MKNQHYFRQINVFTKEEVTKELISRFFWRHDRVTCFIVLFEPVYAAVVTQSGENENFSFTEIFFVKSNI